VAWDADQPSGAKCLVAWDAVCHPKHEGGLSIKSLATKNECLQLKLVHRLHSCPDATWPRWAWSEAAAHAMSGQHWWHLAALVPLYRSISVAVVGDGFHTAFWLDCWVGGVPLGVRWPVLLSHALDTEATVAAVLQCSMRQAMVPRLSSEGVRQLPALLNLVSGVVLTSAADSRTRTRRRRKDGALDALAL
jgi:hypothetical protein